MAEMTVAEAIAVLHNNQYQKHIGNGEYDYIHPLTDAQAKGIECLIEQQAQEIAKNDRMIELAVRQLSKSKKCAMWITSECFHKEKPLRAKCPDDGCWLAWLEKEAEGGGAAMFMDNAMQIINSYNENDALKADLAAANAELAAIRETGPVMYWLQKTQTVQDGLCEVLLQKVELEKQVLSANERAEQAEAQCVYWENKYKEITNG